jgi:hypothetical protein
MESFLVIVEGALPSVKSRPQHRQKVASLLPNKITAVIFKSKMLPVLYAGEQNGSGNLDPALGRPHSQNGVILSPSLHITTLKNMQSPLQPIDISLNFFCNENHIHGTTTWRLNLFHIMYMNSIYH